MYKILIIEDDFIISNSIKNYLNKWDYKCEVIDDFKNILEKFILFNPELVILDISLPYFSGYYWCTEFRKISKVPIIFISSNSDNMNIIMAINMGGDDFISKPFDLNVLNAKVQAIIRRTYSFQGQTNIISYKNVMLNINDVSVIYGNKKLELTKNEFKIIQLLLENAGKIVSRDEIIIKLWENESFIDDNTLTVNVTRLRKKLESIELKNFIKTKKGIGYIVE